MIFATIYGFVTLALMIGFVALCVWAYSPRQRQRFNDDANIPFIDESNRSSMQGRVA